MDKIKDLIKNKKILIIIVLFVLILLLVLLKSSKKNNSMQPPPTKPTKAPLTQSVELKEAIASQQKVDRQYGNWQQTTRENYPWINKMPMYSEKYFVYFDIDRKIFVGKIYPGLNDNIDQIKNSIINELKTKKEVPESSLQFDWKINPQ